MRHMKTRLWTTVMFAAVAAGADAVDGPPAYAREFALLEVVLGAQDQLVHTVYANELAGRVTTQAQLPYADGAIFVMEFAHPKKGADGKPALVEGKPEKDTVQRVDVMRRVAGSWEYSEYSPVGKVLIAPSTTNACAACHRRAESTDFVFRAKRL